MGRKLSIDDDDLDLIMSILLEQEKPLSTNELAEALIQNKLQQETALLENKFKDVVVYDPSRTYEIGQRLLFPALEYATAVIIDQREGNNLDLGTFDVIRVEFEDGGQNSPDIREFASNLSVAHKLNRDNDDDDLFAYPIETSSSKELLTESFIQMLKNFLQKAPELASVGEYWFLRDLILEVNIGHLNLAEASLALAGGVPLDTAHILSDIGSLGDSSLELQLFSLNYHLKHDRRFDEVGPAGQILWHLSEMQPNEVKQIPSELQYAKIEYDRALLSSEMLALEEEIADEYSPIDTQTEIDQDAATITLIYPHRRLGTFPLNQQTRQIFPKATTASRIWITLIDKQDGEEFSGWVVPAGRYVYGLERYYRKHRLPVGAYVSVARENDNPGRIIVSFEAYPARIEWIRLISIQNTHLSFKNEKRAIGANYDDLMIIGADDLERIDALHRRVQDEKRTLFAIMKEILPELGRLTPQGTVHAKTLYSAINILRRCPPGPILAILSANPEFQNMGGQYWKLTG
ncbi:MAG: hypothetical protein D6737_00715 [Chloroflexi bacterium]|nr:MAG: hypothetical protein CUN54_04515 [Phototrophicales bacterium]RMF82784.1 MAG: hypothetical protein D6737_00715 [Chloroflexota bacterium]